MLACAALGAILGLQFLPPPGDDVSAPPGLAARRMRPVTILPAPSYPAVLAAPIFAPDRKPGPGGSAMPGGGPLAGFAALGSAVGGAASSGIVVLPGGQVRTLHVGDDMSGWRLVGVDRSRLVFERKDVRHALIVGAPAEAATETATTPTAQANEQ